MLSIHVDQMTHAGLYGGNVTVQIMSKLLQTKIIKPQPYMVQPPKEIIIGDFPATLYLGFIPELSHFVNS